MKVWKCELCGENFDTEDEANEHANTDHQRPAREIISLEREI